MARILCDNSGVSQMQPLAFQTPSGVNQVTMAATAMKTEKHLLPTRWFPATTLTQSQGQVLTDGVQEVDKSVSRNGNQGVFRIHICTCYIDSVIVHINNIYLMACLEFDFKMDYCHYKTSSEMRIAPVRPLPLFHFLQKEIKFWSSTQFAIKGNFYIND